MDHTFQWLGRKYKQAAKEEYYQGQARTVEGMKSLLLVVDQIFNKGQSFETLMPSYEQALKMNNEGEKEEEQNEKFVSGQWWNKKAETS